jgi:hypothetical protein
MTPLLILLFGVHPTTAVGTDLLFAASTTRIAPCCARAASGHAAAPLSNVMNSRRFMYFPQAEDRTLPHR